MDIDNKLHPTIWSLILFPWAPPHKVIQHLESWFHSLSYSFIAFCMFLQCFFLEGRVILGIKFRASHFLDEASATWPMAPVLLPLVCFSDRILCFCSEPVLYCKSPIYTSQVSGIKDTYHHAWPPYTSFKKKFSRDTMLYIISCFNAKYC
jgi:hypothetical protein